jgi:3-dehydroquinate synthetase
VVIDIAAASGQEDQRGRSGAMSEAIKYALLGDRRIFELVEQAPVDATGLAAVDRDGLPEIVERCVFAKLRLVLADEFDTKGVRSGLNLGHTLSHALEEATGYRLRHGEAVGYGLVAALAMGVELGITPPKQASRARAALRRFGLATAPLDVDQDAVTSYIAADKKRTRGRTRWILVDENGATMRADVPERVASGAITRALAGLSGMPD